VFLLGFIVLLACLSVGVESLIILSFIPGCIDVFTSCVVGYFLAQVMF